MLACSRRSWAFLWLAAAVVMFLAAPQISAQPEPGPALESSPALETPQEHAEGPLMFQGNHGPVAYRNIVVKPLKK